MATDNRQQTAAPLLAPVRRCPHGGRVTATVATGASCVRPQVTSAGND